MNMTVKTAYRRSIETVIDWIGSEVNTSKTYILFRTYAPVHFRFALSLKPLVSLVYYNYSLLCDTKFQFGLLFRCPLCFLTYGNTIDIFLLHLLAILLYRHFSTY